MNRFGAVTSESLFAVAREDEPRAAERDAMWNRIADATGVAVLGAACAKGSGGVASAKAAGAASGFKLVLVGALVGALSAALGAVAVTARPSDETPGALDVRAPGAHVGRTVARGAQLADPAPRQRAASDERVHTEGRPQKLGGDRPAEAANDRAAGALPIAPTMSPSSSGLSASDLAEEARLVTLARSALLAGDAARSLSLVQATRRLGTRALEPEELGLMARALHALGRVDEAAATELQLRSRFPGHALSK